MKKTWTVFIIFLLSFVLTIMLGNCGLEDFLYIQVPSEFDTYDTDNNYPSPNMGSLENVFKKNLGYVRCKADNQEHDRQFNLLVGYDIYYSFTSGSGFKKANVYNPFLNKDDDHEANLTLYNLSGETFPDGSLRFPGRYFNSLYDNFYSTTTFPILLNMIDYLNDRDYNLQFCFFDDVYNDNATDGYMNPYIRNNAVILENVGPNYSEYQGLTWYKKILENNDKFLGFYDYRYYKNKSIVAYDENTTTHIYKMWFYVIAKGFNSGDEVDRIPSYTESTKTATMFLYFEVNENDVTIYE
ncbi:MAG: hypothetical protein II707_00880 [Spirochaetales bacterium]|nr:hypothetical protein [Spirochaetales bacterium]